MYFYGPGFKCNSLRHYVFTKDDDRLVALTGLQTDLPHPLSSRLDRDFDHQPLLQHVSSPSPSQIPSRRNAQVLDSKSPMLNHAGGLAAAGAACLTEEVPLETLYPRDNRREVY